MKKILFPTALAILLSTAFIPVSQNKSVDASSNHQSLFEYPDNVMAIVDNKCMGCHKPDSRNEKAKKKLQWSQLQTMDKGALIGTLDEILEELEEGSMPPAKLLEKYPGKALTEDESKTLSIWADKLAEELSGE